MNVHHLELFYYVARHGGISAAVRNIPYGIQQPAVSGQILQLEDDLGVTLFHRRPFELTRQGEQLYEFIRPFFENVAGMGEKLRGGETQQLRISASPIVLRDHLPGMLQNLRKRFPKLKLTLHEGLQPENVELLGRREVDVAITVLDGKPPAGIKAETLLEVPLVLLAPKNHPLKSVDELWKRDRIQEPLICLPPDETVARNFYQGLSKLGVDWPVSIQVNSLELIEAYVANGFGLGVSVAFPGPAVQRTVKVFPLDGFKRVGVAAFWQGQLNPITQALVEEIRQRAKSLR